MVSQDCVPGELAGQTGWLPGGTRAPGDVAELQVQEARVAMDPALACGRKAGSSVPLITIPVISPLLHPSELWPFWL